MGLDNFDGFGACKTEEEEKNVLCRVDETA